MGNYDNLLKNVDIGVGELSPGATKPRYEPEGGFKKHKERIQRESKIADDYKNLPFQFSKPKKAKRHVVVKCKKCGHISSAPKNTIGIICSGCKKYSAVEVLD